MWLTADTSCCSAEMAGCACRTAPSSAPSVPPPFKNPKTLKTLNPNTPPPLAVPFNASNERTAPPPSLRAHGRCEAQRRRGRCATLTSAPWPRSTARRDRRAGVASAGTQGARREHAAGPAFNFALRVCTQTHWSGAAAHLGGGGRRGAEDLEGGGLGLRGLHHMHRRRLHGRVAHHRAHHAARRRRRGLQGSAPHCCEAGAAHRSARAAAPI